MTLITSSSLSYVLLVIAGLLWVAKRLSKSRKLPPGPPGLPILGNALEIPGLNPWFYYTQLKATFGDVVHLNALGNTMIFLNSHEAIQDLLVKRGGVYSGRPHLPMTGDLVGFGETIVLAQPDSEWLAGRKLIHKHFGPVGLTQYNDIMDFEARRLAHEVLGGKSIFIKAARSMLANTILQATYGSEANDTANAEFAEWSVEIFEASLSAADYPVNALPILRYVPEWFPFIKFKKQAAEWRRELDLGVTKPFEKVRAEMSSGKARPSFTTRMLEDPSHGLSVRAMCWLSGIIYAGAVPNTSGLLSTFLLAMVLHPDVQKKAQEEIDRVVGVERLPVIADRAQLPYLSCVMKEMARWRVPTPLGVPHMSTEDRTYRADETDWTIPEGAWVSPNVYALSRDPSVFDSPEEFIPERYESNPGLPSGLTATFGFGRRVCPGQDFAEAMIFIAAATLLATTNMLPALDENGNPVIPSSDYSGVLANVGPPFPSQFEPRSRHAAELLESAILGAE